MEEAIWAVGQEKSRGRWEPSGSDDGWQGAVKA